MSTEYYAYTHRKPDGAVFYVGAGTRKRAHDFSHRSDAHKRTTVECGGKRSITVMLTPCDSKESAYATEVALIAHYRAVGEPLVNQSSGGAAGCRYPAEVRAKLSALRVGRTRSAETKAKMSAAKRGERNPFYGQTHTAETKAKMSALRVGKPLSAETKAKMSASRTGKTRTAETKAKISAPQAGGTRSAETKAKMSAAKRNERNPFYGKTHTAETKAKMSAALKACWAARRSTTGDGK